MTPPDKLSTSLRDCYSAETSRIRRNFVASGDAGAAVAGRSALVDTVITRLHRELISDTLGGSEGFCVAALGGYGRRVLFPYSDVDLLFLYEDTRTEKSLKETVAALSRVLWDLGLRLSPSARLLDECEVLDRDNLEFSISLLDGRYLAGDPALFASLREQEIPELVAQERWEMIHHLAELTRRRHQSHGNTIFHLEPNVKEAPGGLRDYHLAGWLAALCEIEKQKSGRMPAPPLAAALGEDSLRAFEFLSAVRCFLHFRQGRDANQLTYELQAEAAAAGIGRRPGEAVPPEEWMRNYFRHARSIHRGATQLLEEVEAARPSLYDLFQDWRSRLSNADFTVVRGRILLRQPAALQDPGVLLGLFEFMARHGLALSAEAERAVEQTLSRLAGLASHSHILWPGFRQILLQPNAAEALRAMHELGVLTSLFPEFRAVDALVVRDFYHRYTVDEHTFLTIENLHRLRRPQGDWERRFAEIFTEVEEPELLFFALLFHDVGKGMPIGNHIQGSLKAVEAIFARLAVEPAECEEIRFLIANHLLMSATLLRRDIFAPETVCQFAETVGTAERLKMLCLFTYADIRAVSPDVLTPWKAEMLWQLYAATTNALARSLDEDRVEASGEENALVERIRALLSEPATEGLGAFLEGFPRRYLATHSPGEIAAHYQMARRLGASPAQLSCRARAHGYELTVLTADRPFLFATLAGVLTAWGMNILKGEAFANHAGIVLDTFRFADPHRTLELNPSEVERLERSLREVLAGTARLEDLLRGRLEPRALASAKVQVPTQIRFDDESSTHSTLLELITQDRPGLLYQVSSTMARLGCNIEVALIDTEGQKVIDVFYLTSRGAKLDAAHQHTLRESLLQIL